jgi:hypothetical protein
MSRYPHEKDVTMLRSPREWDRVMSSGGAAERAAFTRWLRASPLNLRAYLMETTLDIELNGLDFAREFDLNALIDIVTRQTPGSGPR